MAPLLLGQARAQIAKRTNHCYVCKEPINLRETYIYLNGFRQREKFASSFHLYCYVGWIESRVNAWTEEAPVRVRKNKPAGLPPEQKIRRRTLQKYLATRDKENLIRAYEKQSTERVLAVMSTIANRWEELNSFGVKFRTSLTTSRRNESDVKLANLVALYDLDWFENEFQEEKSVEEKIAALRRSPDRYPPRWIEKVEMVI